MTQQEQDIRFMKMAFDEAKAAAAEANRYAQEAADLAELVFFHPALHRGGEGRP